MPSVPFGAADFSASGSCHPPWDEGEGSRFWGSGFLMMGSELGPRILDADFRMKDAGSRMPNLSILDKIWNTFVSEAHGNS